MSLNEEGEPLPQDLAIDPTIAQRRRTFYVSKIAIAYAAVVFADDWEQLFQVLSSSEKKIRTKFICTQKGYMIEDLGVVNKNELANVTEPKQFPNAKLTGETATQKDPAAEKQRVFSIRHATNPKKIMMADNWEELLVACSTNAMKIPKTLMCTEEGYVIQDLGMVSKNEAAPTTDLQPFFKFPEPLPRGQPMDN